MAVVISDEDYFTCLADLVVLTLLALVLMAWVWWQWWLLTRHASPPAMRASRHCSV